MLCGLLLFNLKTEKINKIVHQNEYIRSEFLLHKHRVFRLVNPTKSVGAYEVISLRK